MASRRSRRLCALVLLGAFTACSSSDDGPGGPTIESWTIGIYMAADNNLDRAATNDINEILRAGVPENVSALILVDRAELGEYGGFGDIPGLPPHSTAKWLRITGNTIEELEDLGEINTADPEMVGMFIDRMAEEEVDRSAIIFWDHGSSFTFGSDDSAPFSRAMGIDEIAAQFREDPLDPDSPYRSADLVGFDACLMSSVEALAEFNDVAPIYIASAELEPGDGWDYTALFNFIGRNPELTPADLAAGIVEGYADYYANNPGRAGGLNVTQAAWSTDTDAISDAIDALAAAYEAATGEQTGNYNLIADLYSALSKSTFYNRRTGSPAERTSWIDVGEFLANHTESAGPGVAAAAESLRQELEAIRIATRADNRDPLVMGLSVYFPANRVGRNSGANDRAPDVDETDARLLEGGYGDILRLVDVDDSSSAIGMLRATDDAPPTLSFTVTDVSQDEVTVDYQAADDVMLVRGDGILLFRTDDDEQLAVVGSTIDSIGVAEIEGEGSLPLLAVLVGPEGVTPSSSSVGFLSRANDQYSVPVALSQGEREERGILILTEDGTVEGLGVVYETGTWAVFPWEDAVELPEVEVAPLSFTVDPVTGDYETNAGDPTAISEVGLSFVELDDASRLSLILSATDIAGNVGVATDSLE